MNWDDFRFFLALARSQTISGAGEALGVDRSTVGRRVGRLEKLIGAQLFVRSESAGYTLTPAAERLLTVAEGMESAVIASTDALRGSDRGVLGIVRIGAPDGIGTMFLAPRLGALLRSYPGLEVELLATARVFNPMHREVDIAISLALPPRGRLVGRKLVDYHLGLFASQSYLDRYGVPESVEALARHSFISYVEDGLFAPELNYLPLISKEIRGRFRSGNLIAQLQATIEGQGIAVLPYFLAAGHRQLRLVLGQRVRLTRSFYIVTHEDDRGLSRLRVVADFIADQLVRHLPLFRGPPLTDLQLSDNL